MTENTQASVRQRRQPLIVRCCLKHCFIVYHILNSNSTLFTKYSYGGSPLTVPPTITILLCCGQQNGGIGRQQKFTYFHKADAALQIPHTITILLCYNLQNGGIERQQKFTYFHKADAALQIPPTITILLCCGLRNGGI